MKHKKILFEQIDHEENNTPEKVEARTLVHNGILSVLYTVRKIAVIVLVTVIGSLALTILINAALQGKDPVTMTKELFETVRGWF